MATTKTPASPRTRRLGKQLLGLRVAAGLTLAEVADQVGKSVSWVSRVETGLILPADRDIEAVYEACGHPVDHNLIGLAQQIRASRSGWWQRLNTLPEPYSQYIGYEAEATVIRQHESTLIPGLCQTEDVARAVITADRTLDAQRIDQRVEARLTRQEVLYQAEYTAIISEAALRCKIGTARQWDEQMERLAKLAQQPNISIRILPFSQNLGAHGNLILLEFGPDEPSLGYVETPIGSLFVESPEEVAVLSGRHDQLLTRALSEEKSLTRLGVKN